MTGRGFPESAAATTLAEIIANAAPRSALARLVREPFRFEFFQAVRLLSLATADNRGLTNRAGAPSVLLHRLSDEEAIRFRTHVGQAFPASPISSFAGAIVTETGGTPVPEMTVTFLGLAGTGGILPWHYTQLLIDQVREKDLGLRDFLDLFNHRLIAHFYRAWAKCHFFVGYESARRRGAADTDRFTRMIYSLVGMGTPGLTGRQLVSDEVFAYYAGHFSHRPRSAMALQQIVTDVCEVPAQIRQFQGQWMYLRTADQTQLRPGGNNRLGASAIAGRRVWGIENRIRVRLGVMDYRNFKKFMPDASGYTILGQLVRSFVGPEFDFDLQLVLSRQEVPPCQLGGAGGVQLGRNAWLFSRPAVDDLDDAVFACEGAPSR